jgi:hypothetical protein
VKIPEVAKEKKNNYREWKTEPLSFLLPLMKYREITKHKIEANTRSVETHKAFFEKGGKIITSVFWNSKGLKMRLSSKRLDRHQREFVNLLDQS